MRSIARIGTATILAAVAGAGLAAGYPDKPLRMIVGFPPGGGADIMARLVGEPLSENLGVQIVIDNRPGAGSATGTGLAAKATPDGYTLLFSTPGLTVNPNLYKSVPFDPIRDFAPVSQVASSPFVLVVHPSSPANSIQELIALAKSKHGAMNYSSGGNGSTGHLATELFKSMAHVEIQHVPYKGLAPALADLMGGRVDLTLASLPSCIGHIRAKRLKALAVTTATRMPFVPDIPTMAEQGLAGYDVDQWYGILAPAGTPKAQINILYRALASFLAKPDAALAETFAKLGAKPVSTTPAEFARFIRHNLALWANVVKVSGARVD
jgi:tripartite-type tricarboxylate transporter receptor subunit TctC